MPIGRVKFFRAADAGFWGITTCNDGRDLFFHGSELQEGTDIARDQWVDFLEDVSHDRPCAISVTPIDCPPEFECQGIVDRFNEDKKFGFIKYAGGEMFFHISDVLLIDGIEYFPAKGCTVDFYIGQKTNKTQAVNVAITSWPPEPEQTVEEYFLSVEPKPELEPEPVASIEESSVLSPQTRKLSLIEIIRRRKK
jgi:cold shock CspA family protein